MRRYRAKQESTTIRSSSLFGVGTQLPWAALLSPEARAEMRAATVAPDVGGTNSPVDFGQSFRPESAADYLGCNVADGSNRSGEFPCAFGRRGSRERGGGGGGRRNGGNLDGQCFGADSITSVLSDAIRKSIGKLAAMEDALRVDLAGAIEEARDKAIIDGDGTAPEC